jgi:hypothetical protein
VPDQVFRDGLLERALADLGHCPPPCRRRSHWQRSDALPL